MRWKAHGTALKQMAGMHLMMLLLSGRFRCLMAARTWWIPRQARFSCRYIPLNELPLPDADGTAPLTQPAHLNHDHSHQPASSSRSSDGIPDRQQQSHSAADGCSVQHDPMEPRPSAPSARQARSHRSQQDKIQSATLGGPAVHQQAASDKQEISGGRSSHAPTGNWRASGSTAASQSGASKPQAAGNVGHNSVQNANGASDTRRDVSDAGFPTAAASQRHTSLSLSEEAEAPPAIEQGSRPRKSRRPAGNLAQQALQGALGSRHSSSGFAQAGGVSTRSEASSSASSPLPAAPVLQPGRSEIEPEAAPLAPRRRPSRSGFVKAGHSESTPSQQQGDPSVNPSPSLPAAPENAASSGRTRDPTHASQAGRGANMSLQQSGSPQTGSAWPDQNAKAPTSAAAAPSGRSMGQAGNAGAPTAGGRSVAVALAQPQSGRDRRSPASIQQAEVSAAQPTTALPDALIAGRPSHRSAGQNIHSGRRASNDGQPTALAHAGRSGHSAKGTQRAASSALPAVVFYAPASERVQNQGDNGWDDAADAGHSEAPWPMSPSPAALCLPSHDQGREKDEPPESSSKPMPELTHSRKSGQHQGTAQTSRAKDDRPLRDGGQHVSQHAIDPFCSPTVDPALPEPVTPSLHADDVRIRDVLARADRLIAEGPPATRSPKPGTSSGMLLAY